MAVLTVHALGEPCPAPVVKATRALQQMTEPGVVEVHVDNEAAVQNLGRMAAGRGLTERLAVGGVTNMYVIVEKLSNAAHILRP